MYKRKIVAGNCMFPRGGKLVKLEIGDIVETSNPVLFGDKAVTVEQMVLEVATPAAVDDEETMLRKFIFDALGQAPASNAKINTLRKKAKSLGWDG